VCFWEDDPEQAERPWGTGGANGISLVQAQQAYLRHGATDADAVSKVRPPKTDEARDQAWQPYDPDDGELHPLYTEEELRESYARGRAHWAAFQAGLRTMRAESGGLSDQAMERMVRQFSDALSLAYGDAEIELFSHLIRDDHWPRKQPRRALAWAWRHRHSTSLPARLSQLKYRLPLAE